MSKASSRLRNSDTWIRKTVILINARDKKRHLFQALLQLIVQISRLAITYNNATTNST